MDTYNSIQHAFDIGVRLASEGMIAVRITSDMEMVVVATPEHFRRYGFPKTFKDLSFHPCIAYISGNFG